MGAILPEVQLVPSKPSLGLRETFLRARDSWSLRSRHSKLDGQKSLKAVLSRKKPGAELFPEVNL